MPGAFNGLEPAAGHAPYAQANGGFEQFKIRRVVVNADEAAGDGLADQVLLDRRVAPQAQYIRCGDA